MTLFKLIETLKMLALKHPNVNSAYEGSIYEIMNANTQQKYASVVLTQQSHSQDENYDHYNFNIFYVDRLVDDMESNRVQIQSTGKSILSNIIKAFCEEFDAECENITFNTFTERFADECAGAYATITIDMLKDIYCTEKYWDGNWSAPVISIKNQDKKVEFTENGSYTITYDNENFTGLGTVEVEVNVETDGSYDEGYTNGLADGIADGIYHQKSKLESITITENGVYEKEDGYDEITVNVIDTNGSYNEGYIDGETEGYTNGLADGIGEGRSYQKSLLESISITENGTYIKEDGYDEIIVNVIDTNGSYEEGYLDGETDGYNDGLVDGFADGIYHQKSLLESITITENGTYTKEDGYNQITVNIEDVNGSYSEGYEDGIEKGIENAAEIIAENAQVLNITESGIYTTKYTKDEDVQITGYFDDGTQFYNYAQLINQVYRSNTKLNQNSVIEFWWKPELTENYAVGTLIDLNKDTYSNNIILQYNTKNAGSNQEKLGLSINSNFYYSKVQVTDKWYHIKIDFTNGFFIDGEKNNDINIDWNITNDYVYINNEGQNLQSANGYFGMVKIDGNTYIPTENGHIDYATNTPLYVYTSGTYNFSQGVTGDYTGDNLIRTVNVNVQPKINIAKEKIKFACADITTIPEWGDFEGVTDMSRMFYECRNLTTIPPIDTSNVTDMRYMFYTCQNLESLPTLNTSNVTNMNHMFTNCNKIITIPLIDTSNVTDMGYMFQTCGNLTTISPIDTSKVTNMEYMFQGCGNLITIPPIDTSKVTKMGYMFFNCKSLESLPTLNTSNVTNMSSVFYNTITSLTDLGGFLDLKISWNDNYGLKMLPNLTYQSCINVLNGLYDFTGNNQTPSSSQGKLKVHANFLTTVGDEIAIGTNKGWTITS